MTSTPIRTMKNVKLDQVGEISAEKTDSEMPMKSAAMTAPPREPSPPSTMIESSLEIRS